MGQRGRTSSAALSVVAGTDIDGRPQSPSDLTEFQRGVWDRTVANEAADVFRTAALQQLLKEYCRHVETADRLSKQVDRATGEGSNLSYQDIDCLLRMRDRETKALADKATKLRLTNQSRYTPGAAATAAKSANEAKKPWQMSG
jgi:hypothetical protein